MILKCLNLARSFSVHNFKLCVFGSNFTSHSKKKCDLIFRQISNHNNKKMDSTKTFSLDDQLPSLKVPSLENTIEKYLDSVKAVANEKEYENTKQICSDFLNGDGKILQEKLKERERDHRNWIEEWWLDKGYLELRFPLMFLNFAGMPSYAEQFWPIKDGTRAERMAFGMHVLGTFWKTLREEKVEPHRANDGSPFSMHQLRTAFNTTRIPQSKIDKLVSFFKTESEGYTPSHTVVICKGYFFKVELMNKVGKPFTPPQLQKALLEIEEICQYRTISAGVAALTALDRETWALARQNLLDLDPVNKHSLHDIDSAIGVATMDDSSPRTDSEIMLNTLNGDPAYRWRDKSYNSVWSKNGTFAASCDHTAIDGMVMVLFMEFSTMMLMQTSGKWKGTMNTETYPKPEELQFVLNNELVEAISKGKKNAKDFDENITLLCHTFYKFGKLELKKLKIYPDAFMQICIQLAYMRLHGTPVATYETATTRQYYHGRTETCRTCTPELVRFCQAVIDGDSNAIALLRPAHDKFVKLIRECQSNQGCDRHLYGLSIAAQKEGMDTPALFKDPMYTKSGGNGNFTLSTSFVGFFNSNGVVAPMVDDGYGTFYRIRDDKFVYTMTSWKHSRVTNAHGLSEMIKKTFVDVLDMFKQDSRTSNL